MQQDCIGYVCIGIACIQESLVTLLVWRHPVNGTHGEIVGHGHDAEFVLAWALAVDDNVGTCCALVEGVLDSVFQFVGKLAQSYILVGRWDRHKDYLLIYARRIGRTEIALVVAQVQLNLVIVQLQEGAALRYYIMSKLLDVVVSTKFLLQLGKDVETKHLVVAICLLVMLCLDNSREFNVECILDVIHADFIGKTAEVNEIFLRQD